MREDRFEQWLRLHAAEYNTPPETPHDEVWAEIDALRAYNRPPETPRDDIWARVAAVRAAARPASAAPLSSAAPVLPRRRGAPRGLTRGRTGWAVALAAMLVIGIGLGRLTLVRDAASPPVGVTDRGVPVTRGEETVAREGTGTERDAGAEPASPAGAEGDVAAPADARSAGASSATDPPRVETLAGVEREAGRDAPARAEPESTPSGSRRSEAGGAYRLAAVQTLSRAEALLTSFRAETGDAANAEQNAQIALWARDVLLLTRLLMDSPASRDPAMDALLDDLELVLVQMIRLDDGDGEDAVLVREAMRQQNMLPRLRDAVPAGRVSIGT